MLGCRHRATKQGMDSGRWGYGGVLRVPKRSANLVSDARNPALSCSNIGGHFFEHPANPDSWTVLMNLHRSPCVDRFVYPHNSRPTSQRTRTHTRTSSRILPFLEFVHQREEHFVWTHPWRTSLPASGHQCRQPRHHHDLVEQDGRQGLNGGNGTRFD